MIKKGKIRKPQRQKEIENPTKSDRIIKPEEASEIMLPRAAQLTLMSKPPVEAETLNKIYPNWEELENFPIRQYASSSETSEAKPEEAF